jgi:glycosyltransferase involved in cell wall biosynthesis
MKILMIAPEPFFEPRGTPFSEYFRIKGLCALNHSVDLVTYPIGMNREIQGLRIFRSWKPFFIRSVKTGPSFSKIILDFFLFFSVLRMLLKEKYDVIHTHEEANILGVFFNKITKIPHLYDMHSSLVQQMTNFQFTKSKIITGMVKMTEKMALKNAASVIVICRALFEYVTNIVDEKKVTVIENFIDDTPDSLELSKLNFIRQQIRPDERKIIMYAGTLETYQGIPLLIESLNYLEKEFTLVLIGGKRVQINGIKKKVIEMNLEDRVRLLGSQPSSEIPYFLKNSDVLVSPRILGTNIPLKIYAYLKSGIPVVATNLYTHTQTLDSRIAILVDPEPEKFATGIKLAVSKKGKIIAKNAIEFCKKNYSFQKYTELIGQALEKAGSNPLSG